MATIGERLTKRFRNVPGVTTDDIADWVTEAEEESGLIEGVTAPEDNALLYLALSIGCKVIAADAARFFTYKDSDETIDKTKIFDNYMRLSSDALARFVYHKNGGGSRTLTPKRADER